MTKTTYSVFEEIRTHEDIGEYITYGIAAENAEQSDVCHDVTADRERAEHIARLFNRHALSLVHFREALEDMLAT